MDKVVVTGAAGFIGSHIAAKLLEDTNVLVVGVDRMSDYYSTDVKRDNLARIQNERFTLYENDLNAVDLESILEGSVAVFHEAGQPGVRPSWGDSFDVYLQDNIRTTQRLLECILRLDRKPKMIYASSSSVYGESAAPLVDESAPTRPKSPYGVTKLGAEHLVSLYGRNFGLDTVSLRYFTVYGPGQRPDMAFTKMCRCVGRGVPFEIYGTGEQVRDFTYVEDIVAANIAALKNVTEPGDVFNVAGGSTISLNGCLSVLEDIVGNAIPRVYEGSASGDVFRTGADTNKAKSILGWTPRTDLRAGLEAQYRWVHHARCTDGYGW